MKRSILTVLLLLAVCHTGMAQVGGNAGAYGGNSTLSRSGGNNQATLNELAKRQPTPAELRPDNSATFIEASVLMNVKADEYVAVFGVAQSGDTVAQANQKLDTTIGAFLGSLKALGIKDDERFVDFVTQTKIYGYRLEENIAKEQLVGFEIKKNVSIHFTDKELLDRLTLAAAEQQIYDLVKVDYIVKDPAAIQRILAVEAARLIKMKAERQQSLLGIKLPAQMQVVAEKPSVYYPAEQYSSYSAYESESIRNNYDDNKYTIQDARKGRTSYFDPLDASLFDTVFNPVVIEPTVQFTTYWKVKFEAGKRK